MRPPVQTGTLLDDKEDELIAELDELAEDDHDELSEDDDHEDEPLEELGGQSHLQQPAPCQNSQGPSYRWSVPPSKQIETERR